MRTFNMGIGLIAVIPAAKFPRAKPCSTAPKKNSTSLAASSKATATSSTPSVVCLNSLTEAREGKKQTLRSQLQN